MKKLNMISDAIFNKITNYFSKLIRRNTKFFKNSFFYI